MTLFCALPQEFSIKIYSVVYIYIINNVTVYSFQVSVSLKYRLYFNLLSVHDCSDVQRRFL